MAVVDVRTVPAVTRLTPAFVSGIGPTELIIVAVLALLVLGPRRLPEAGRGLGRGMREFKDAVAGRAEGAGGPPSDPPAIDNG